jgi:hypothetical protein
MSNDNRFALLGKPTPTSAQAGSTGGLAAGAPAPAPAEQPRRNPNIDFDMSDPESEVEEGADSEASAEEQVLPVVIKLALAAARNIASQPLVDVEKGILGRHVSHPKKSHFYTTAVPLVPLLSGKTGTINGPNNQAVVHGTQTPATLKAPVQSAQTPAVPNSKTSQKKARKAAEAAARRKAMDEADTTMGGTQETDDLEEGEIREEAGKEFDTGDNDTADDNWDLYENDFWP